MVQIKRWFMIEFHDSSKIQSKSYCEINDENSSNCCLSSWDRVGWEVVCAGFLEDEEDEWVTIGCAEIVSIGPVWTITVPLIPGTVTPCWSLSSWSIDWIIWSLVCADHVAVLSDKVSEILSNNPEEEIILPDPVGS